MIKRKTKGSIKPGPFRWVGCLGSFVSGQGQKQPHTEELPEIFRALNPGQTRIHSSNTEKNLRTKGIARSGVGNVIGEIFHMGFSVERERPIQVTVCVSRRRVGQNDTDSSMGSSPESVSISHKGHFGGSQVTSQEVARKPSLHLPL